jgi:osmotically-inducible protein OsmY
MDRDRKDFNFGKGPKGYVRSQDRIFQDVCEALARDPDVDAQDIEVSVNEGIVTLKGTVLSRRMKRFAEETVEIVLGVGDIINILNVIGEAKNYNKNDGASPLGGNYPH